MTSLLPLIGHEGTISLARVNRKFASILLGGRLTVRDQCMDNHQLSIVNFALGVSKVASTVPLEMCRLRVGCRVRKRAFLWSLCDPSQAGSESDVSMLVGARMTRESLSFLFSLLSFFSIVGLIDFLFLSSFVLTSFLPLHFSYICSSSCLHV